jgi:transposase-like protein/YHS domain-containing protein
MDNKSSFSSSERTCPVCGRKFIITSQWTYKLIVKGHTTWFCRYNCVRAAERKLNDKKVGRNKTMIANKPKSEVLEADLRAGLPIPNIAKKYGCTTTTIHNWIRSYGLAGIQGVKKPKDETPESTPLSGRSRPPMTSGVAVTTQEAPPVNDMVQQSPSLAEIEQFHTDGVVQELPQVGAGFDPVKPIDLPGTLAGFDLSKAKDTEIKQDEPTASSWPSETPIPQSVNSPDPVPKLRRNFEEVWQDARDDITQLRVMYDEQADDDFREQLINLVLAVTKGRGLVG